MGPTKVRPHFGEEFPPPGNLTQSNDRKKNIGSPLYFRVVEE